MCGTLTGFARRCFEELRRTKCVQARDRRAGSALLLLAFALGHVGVVEGDAGFDLGDGGFQMLHCRDAMAAFVGGGVILENIMGFGGEYLCILHDGLLTGPGGSEQGEGGSDEERGFRDEVHGVSLLVS